MKVVSTKFWMHRARLLANLLAISVMTYLAVRLFFELVK